MSISASTIIRPPTITASVPVDLAYAITPVEVWQETINEDAWAEVSDRIQCERIEWRSDELIDRAYFHIVFDELKPPMTDAAGNFRRDYLAAAQQMADPNRRLQVRFGTTDRRKAVCRFQGYPNIDTVSWSRNPRDHSEGLSFTAVGAIDHWRYDRWAQIVGRTVQKGPTHTNSTLADLREVQAAPCTFNENGKPNCAPFPVYVNVPVGQSGSIRVPLYVFAAPGEAIQYASAGTAPTPVRYWSYARALVYLLYVHGVRSYGQVNEDRPVALPYEWTSKLINQDVLTMDPPLSYGGTEFGRAMLGRPNNLECDRTSLLDALTIVCADAGAHFHVDYAVGTGRAAEPELKLWTEGVDGAGNEPPTPFELTRGVPRKSAPVRGGQALEQNRAMAGRVTRDWEAVLNLPVIAGGRRLYESTFKLLPGWRPVAILDEVLAADHEDAKDFWRPLGSGSTETLGSLAKYLRSDPEHYTVRDVGRKWVLNEAGTYFPELYGRCRPPLACSSAFNDAAYVPFDPARTPYEFADMQFDPAEPGADPKLIRIPPGAWVLRPRPFGNLLRDAAQTDGEPPICQISFDAGDHWQDESRFEVLEEEAAIRFVPESPLDITPVDPVTGRNEKWWEDNLFFALIEGRFRVEVTATIEGDELVVPRWSSRATASGSPVDRLRCRIFDRPAFEVMTRHRSIFSDLETGPDSVIRSDLKAADVFRAELGRNAVDKQPAVQVTMPWVDGRPEIGQAATGFAGIGVSVARRLEEDNRDPQIVGVDYQLTGVQETVLVIGDIRHTREERLETRD